MLRVWMENRLFLKAESLKVMSVRKPGVARAMWDRGVHGRTRSDLSKNMAERSQIIAFCHDLPVATFSVPGFVYSYVFQLSCFS
jgi:hypothetical protein